MNKPIRLFVIGPRGFPDVQGGIERFSEKLYPELIGKGYSITTFALKKYSKHKTWKGINFIQLRSPSSKTFEKPVYNLFAAFYCILKRPDIVHIHSIASGMIIFLLKMFRLKVIARYNSQDYLHNKWNFLGKYILKNCLLSSHIPDNAVDRNNNRKRYRPHHSSDEEQNHRFQNNREFFGGVVCFLFVDVCNLEKNF